MPAYPYTPAANLSDQTPAGVLSRVLDATTADMRIVGARTLANLASRNRVRSVSKTNIEWLARFSGSTSGILPVKENTTDTAVDKVTSAVQRVGFYKVFAKRSFSRIAIAEAASRAPGELRDIFAEDLQSATLEIARQLNSLIYTGDGTAAKGEFDGLALALDNTKAYAGIDPVAWPDWKAITMANAGTPRQFTRRLMLDQGVIYGNLERQYDLVIMSPLTAAKYQELFDTLGAAASLPMATEPGVAALKRADLGHGGRYYNGMPIVEDPTCPDGQMLFLNSSDISMPCFVVGNTPGNPISNIAVNSSIGVPIHIAELPSPNSLFREFEFYCMPQMNIRNRRAVGVMKDLII